MMELFFKCVGNNRFLKEDNIVRFFLPWMAAENICEAPSAVSMLSREYYCSVMMCFYSVILIPQGRTTFTSTMPSASLWQEVLRRTVRFYKTDTKGTRVEQNM